MPSKDNGITIRVISNVKDLLQIEHQWNSLVNKASNNPFLLSEFTKQFIEHSPKGWTPMILTISNNQAIIGIVPLKTRKNLVGRHVDFLNPPWCADFIFSEQHKDTCIKITFDFLFDTLKCNFANFTLPIDSPNLKLLTQQCKLNKLIPETKPEMGRRIIPIKSQWTEYEASLPRKFKKDLRRTERNLSKTGLWTVRHVEGNEQQDITKKINGIEERSWKETWRNQRGENDWILASVIEAAQQLSRIETNFKWGSWFLELEGKTIAYTLVIKYKQVAYFVKTSYDEQYKRFYPGIIVQNSAIHQIFTEQQNKYIDFLSDLPYLQEWTDDCLPRFSIQLTKGALPIMIHFLLKNRFVSKIISAIYSNVVYKKVSDD
jgi:CelD/BcsL family acetyltransferase involved in cellulose biosynthesis